MALFLTVLLILIIIFVVIYILVIRNTGDSLLKYLAKKKIRVSRKSKKWVETLEPKVKTKIIEIFEKGHDVMVGLEGNELDNSFKISNVEDIDLDEFFTFFKMIRVADPLFSFNDMLAIYVALGKSNKDSLESFVRSWCDQVNAGLDIDFETAYEYVKKGRDFSKFVNLDIMAKRAEIDINEKRLINDIADEEGLKIIIYSLIRAKYEGIYLSEDDSLKINKANILEYNDTFKITQNMLMDLYNLKRDVNRFTNVMIRAHNSGIRIAFSYADLYSLTDSEFDNLVSNIIRASDNGINIDQKDLIRQNIQGTNITNLITALINSTKKNLDFTPDELMNYFVNTRADVVKYVEAVAFSKSHNLNISKDDLVAMSKPNVDLLDYVTSVKLAQEYSQKDPESGITLLAIKNHFLKFGKVKETLDIVIKCRTQLGLDMNFGIANKIVEGTEYTLKSAVAWAQNPQVLEVDPIITCVCKNGVQVTPKVNITVVGKMEQIFWGYKLDVLFKRINEALISEISAAETHEVVLNTLPQISQNVLNRINEEDNKEIKTTAFSEDDLNKHCSYNLLDVNVYDMIIGVNIKAELELRQAQINSEMRKLQAEADRAKAEADLRKAMVQQYKEGWRPNFNELHKANLLTENNKDINTGYEVPENEN